MKKKAVILFMASVLALGTLVGCNTADKEDLEGFKNAMSSVVSATESNDNAMSSVVSATESNDNAMSSVSSAIGSKDTVKVTYVKGITFERPSEWSNREDSGDLFLFPTNNGYDYIISFEYDDLGSAYKDFEWDKQVVDALTEKRKAVMTHGAKFTYTSDEEVIVCGKYARKVSASYSSYDGTEYNKITYMFGNSRYFYAFTNYYKSSLGNTYEKEFENIIKSIQFETVPEYSKEENSKVSTPENASSKVEVSKEESSKTESTGMTMGQSNALKRVLSDLEWSAYSRAKLIENLEDDKYSHEDTVFAVDNCGADWNEQALREAKSQLEYSNTSRADLLEDLVKYDKFTQEQAEYAVNNCGADWNEQALKSARSTLEYSNTSRADLLEDLVKYDKFTQEQAEYAVNNCGADWNEQAVKAAKSHLEYSAYSRDELIEWLVHFDKFTQEQAEYAVKQVGY